MRNFIRRRNQNLRRGATTVELAVVAPLLILMMLGFLEIGYAFLVKQTLGLAANRAARVATLPGYTGDDVRASIDDTLERAGLSGYEVTTNLDELGPTDRNVWVQVTLPLDRALFTGSLLGGGNFDITERRTSHREMDPNLSVDN
ncbi:MAG TPA: TadE/TadG family type IV pilus assembly protein [Phycisphaerae bacterium]|nr:TadE/TadG family type IV pilus assembly protein [Phycisphaerae bacterium]